MIAFRVTLKTTNPLNANQRASKSRMFRRAEFKADQRGLLRLLTQRHAKGVQFPLCVTITRVAPSMGLDPHDGLGAALKSCIDGVADGLGLKNDRDPRVRWILDQKRGKAREYAVEVAIVAG